jgi:hypothetical protein
MKTKSNEEIGLEAAKIARQKVLKEAKSVKLTTRRILQRISEGLDANEVKISYDTRAMRFFYAKPRVDHGRRLDAAQLGILIHDMKPCERKKIELSGNLNLSNLTDEELADIVKGKIPKGLIR